MIGLGIRAHEVSVLRSEAQMPGTDLGFLARQLLDDLADAAGRAQVAPAAGRHRHYYAGH